MRKNHKIDGLRLAVKGFIVFSKYGDAWLGSHDKERLQAFIRQHPWLNFKISEIIEVSSKLSGVRIIKPNHLREAHAEEMKTIPSPRPQIRGKRNLLPASALREDS